MSDEAVIVEERIVRRSDAAHATEHRFANPATNAAQFGLQSGMHVADFGSGSGAYVLAMASIVGPGGRVYAVDVQKDLLRRTKRTADEAGLHNVDIVWGDAEKQSGTHIADHSVDAVLLSNILFQVQHKEAIFSEARRIVKSGGTIIVIDWSESFGGMGPRSVDVYTKESAKALGVATGCALVREFSAGAHHYGLIFRAA